ncbi:NUDIX hydrolase [uncultured Acetatifactor sp.]|uniref:NUDIX hydrolase n=1 Tax=uncultured Acetatifactor sp. TaxID=1671927 RepID=UPI0026190436|nr:NUDIX domain-containing protein [uncultured Acetatifactor sp.]
MDTEYESFICRDCDGNVLISIEKMDESTISQNPLLTHCLAIVKIGDDFLFGWNKWRNRYEIFGGCIEEGESPRACIVRECNEELGIAAGDIRYLGAMKFLLMPDYFSERQRIEYGGLYGISLPDCSLKELSRQIKDREEIGNLAFYSKIKGNKPIAQIDEKLLDYVRRFIV